MILYTASLVKRLSGHIFQLCPEALAQGALPNVAENYLNKINSTFLDRPRLIILFSGIITQMSAIVAWKKYTS